VIAVLDGAQYPLHLLVLCRDAGALPHKIPRQQHMAYKAPALETDKQMQPEPQPTPPTQVVVDIVTGLVGHIPAI